MNILLMLAHSIEEHDQLRLLSSLGYDVFSLGGYIDPLHPHDPKRLPLPQVPRHLELKAAVDNLGSDDNLENAKRRIPDQVLDWADVIICHHYEYNWLWPQWERIRDKRVIWRTVGQSTTANELRAAPFREDGLQVVRYSPKERNIPGFVGEDALIRFYKDEDEWTGWTGQNQEVINITQHLAQRGDATNGRFWLESTSGLRATALGPGSTVLNGPGELTLSEMHHWLRSSRAYLYTGTQPASYTLGMIEAMMTGIPVVSIGPAWMRMLPYGPELFEAHELIGEWTDSPAVAHQLLRQLLENETHAKELSEQQQSFTRRTFGMEVIGEQWKSFLG